MTFRSEIRCVGHVKFPEYSGLRVMMMPFRLDDLGTVPESMAQWRRPLKTLRAYSRAKDGVAYLTIDEAFVPAGETHRRPGLHVDGIGPDGREAAWGGGGGYGAQGMLLASSVMGCVGWNQSVLGYPGPNGDCAHLASALKPSCAVTMNAGGVYLCSPLAVHQPLAMRADTRRQFVRLSMPNDCPWYEGYTENPTGVKPTGPIHPRREEFMAYRAAPEIIHESFPCAGSARVSGRRA